MEAHQWADGTDVIRRSNPDAQDESMRCPKVSLPRGATDGKLGSHPAVEMRLQECWLHNFNLKL